VPNLVIEDGSAFARRLADLGVERLRLLGAAPGAARGDVLRAAADAGISVLADPPVAAGRRELLSMLREQAISRTLHRFGHLPG
jgi:RHH-type proline utilization regulon transcriptional repressor/proline dehydrogenase/delta 1-pyrroline-5-carboxylate dehydrogenase